MSLYLIGVGGTGARCVEAILHLSAAGLLPDEKLYALFVDPDRSNGNLDRTRVTLEAYRACQQIETGKTALFQTPISTADPNTWSPFDDNTNSTLSDALSYDALRTQDERAADLFDVLYSQEERKANLGVGFRGHPSIGAAILAQGMNVDAREPWATFESRVSNDIGAGETVRIFLLGSIFGGTGAAGVPTIGQSVRKMIDQPKADIRIGCGLVLPYFSFNFGDQVPQDLKADSSSFVPNTQAALKYYNQRDYEEIFDRLYVFGNDSMSDTGEASLGGRRQTNRAHYIELVAGLAAADFYTYDSGDGRPVAMAARRDKKEVRWDDLPYSNNAELSDQMVQLTRCAMAFLSQYHPAIEHARKQRKKSYAYPWYIDYFEKKTVQDEQLWSKLERFGKYCERYLDWMAQIHGSAEGQDVSLLSTSSFAKYGGSQPRGESLLKKPENFEVERFAAIDKDREEIDEFGLHRLWRHMSHYKPADELSGAGAFIRALYDGCARDVVEK